MAKYNSMANQRKLYQRQGGVCNGCREPLKLRHLAVDHIVPRKAGGTHELGNLQLLCGSCNSVKGERSQSYLTERLNKRNWCNRRSADSTMHALVWTGSRWVDVFELMRYVDDPESCTTVSVTGTKTPIFANEQDHEQARSRMVEGLRELLGILDPANAQ